MLSRFRAAKREELDTLAGHKKRCVSGGWCAGCVHRLTRTCALRLPPPSRPWIASEVTNIKECEKWRQDLLSQIAKKIKEIQNGAGLDKLISRC